MWKLVLVLLLACKADTNNNERAEKLKAAIAEMRAPYMKTIDAFTHATSTKQYGDAYDVLAPAYTNMVSRDRFITAIATNHNFDQPRTLDVYQTRMQGGTIAINGAYGELGRAEVAFVDTPNGPRITSFTIGGLEMLPRP